jgi:hypothetical protein
MQTLGSIEAVAALLDRLEAAEPVGHGALTMVPLLAPGEPEPGWLTLAEAGAAVTIEEVSEAGKVPALRLVNGADRPVLLLDGEELVLDTTVLVDAGARLRIPVSCVEQGRWRYRGRRLTSSDAWLFASARAKKAARVSESLRLHGKHASDQGQIWADVNTTLRKVKVASATGAMRDFYDRHAGALAAARRALAPLPGQAGAIVGVSGRWVGLDLLASPGLFARAWPQLCAGYAAEALGEPPAARAPGAGLLRRVAALPVEEAPAAGLGREYRIAAARVAGAALVVRNVLAHLMVFPISPAPR